MDIVQMILAVLCGSLVGFTLGLIGGGGSIMATPLLLYVVGLPPHVAIGTGALAVSANSFINFGGMRAPATCAGAARSCLPSSEWQVQRSDRRWVRHSTVSVCSFCSPS